MTTRAIRPRLAIPAAQARSPTPAKRRARRSLSPTGSGGPLMALARLLARPATGFPTRSSSPTGGSSPGPGTGAVRLPQQSAEPQARGSRPPTSPTTARRAQHHPRNGAVSAGWTAPPLPWKGSAVGQGARGGEDLSGLDPGLQSRQDHRPAPVDRLVGSVSQLVVGHSEAARVDDRLDFPSHP